MELATTYLGLPLRNPLVASASPLSQTADGVIELVEGGVAAVVLHSLFEEQIEQESVVATDPAPPHHFDNPAGPGGPRRYLDLVEESVRSVDVPVIASLNGTSRRGWTAFARRVQEAGAAAVECNFYTVPEPVSWPVGELEVRCLDVVHALTQELDIPVAVKLTPYFSSFGTLAQRLVEVGAAGLVLFNRFLQPAIDVTTMTVTPSIGLSRSADARLPQTWIALLRQQVTVSLAGTGGVEGPRRPGRLPAGRGRRGRVRVGVPAERLRLRHDASSTGSTPGGTAHGFATVADARGRLAVPWQVDAEEYSREGYIAALQHARRSYRHH